MKKFKTTSDAIIAFTDAAIGHGEGTLDADYKKANKCYATIKQAYDYLCAEENQASLLSLLSHENDSVICWAASYLLYFPDFHFSARNALEKIVQKTGIIAHGADMTIREWERKKQEQ